MGGRQSRASIVSRASRKSASAALSRRNGRSRSRDRLNQGYLSSQQDNDSLNEDEETEEEEDDNWATSTDNNWTDYDQDIYMHRNTTKFQGGHHMRGGMFARDDVNL